METRCLAPPNPCIHFSVSPAIRAEAGECPVSTPGPAQRPGHKRRWIMTMTQSTNASSLASDSSPEIPQWGEGTPKGAKHVLSRMIKDGANVPLFVSQTLVNSLRDVGYNSTTSA